MTNFSIVLFNTQLKSLRHDGNLYTFINVMLPSLLHNNEALKVFGGEAHMMSV